jgi:voltage-gated potassium channel
MYRILLLFLKKRSLFLFEQNRQKVILIFFLLYWYAVSGFLYFELPEKPDLNWLDAMWWALVTMTTVGYGDYFPVTTGGRYLVGIPTMIFGIGFLGFIISEVAAKLIETRSMRLKGMADINFEDHILLINYSRLENVLEIIKELKSDRSTINKEICLIDETLTELPGELHKYNIRYVRGNPTREATLIQANIHQASHAVILSKDPGDPHSDDLNLAATLVIESIHPDIFSIVQVIDPGKIKQMELAGCDSAVCVSEFTANLVIQELQDPGVKSIIQELTSNRFGLQIYFTKIVNMNTWKYRELVDWGLENNFTILGLQRNGEQILNCEPSQAVMNSDKAIIIGKERMETIEIQ